MIVAVFSITLLASLSILSVAFSNPCKLSTTEKCDLSDMTKDESYLVQPDKSAGTYCIDSSPYQFEACLKKLMLQMN
jgi:hypothetical protein